MQRDDDDDGDFDDDESFFDDGIEAESAAFPWSYLSIIFFY